jgi:hypothetical protein
MQIARVERESRVQLCGVTECSERCVGDLKQPLSHSRLLGLRVRHQPDTVLKLLVRRRQLDVLTDDRADADRSESYAQQIQRLFCGAGLSRDAADGRSRLLGTALSDDDLDPVSCH